MAKDSSHDQYAGIARALSTEHGVATTLENACTTALQIIDRCDHAGISLVVKGSKVDAVTTSDEVASRAYELQNLTGEGPCMDTVEDQETVYVADLRGDQRWPDWSAQVADELEVRSVLSLQLFIGPRTFGSLDLFSATPDAFHLEDRLSALALAAHVAVAMTAAQQRQGTETALLNRAVIGRAEGRLIERLGIKADEAFTVLVRASQARNVKLVEVAADIAENGVPDDMLG